MTKRYSHLVQGAPVTAHEARREVKRERQAVGETMVWEPTNELHKRAVEALADPMLYGRFDDQGKARELFRRLVYSDAMRIARKQLGKHLKEPQLQAWSFLAWCGLPLVNYRDSPKLPPAAHRQRYLKLAHMAQELSAAIKLDHRLWQAVGHPVNMLM